MKFQITFYKWISRAETVVSSIKPFKNKSKAYERILLTEIHKHALMTTEVFADLINNNNIIYKQGQSF